MHEDFAAAARLPRPDPEAERRSERLCAVIRDEIGRSGGDLPFSRFMELVLHEPGLGYYQTDHALFGPRGDFVTAPEISRLFGRCVARQAGRLLRLLDGDEIVEFGAGSGAMAADILTELARLGHPPREYRIVEISATLRERQRRTIQSRCAEHAARLAWADRTPHGRFRGVVLANEVLDAMPAVRFHWDGREAREWRVTWASDRFAWKLGPPLCGAAKERFSCIAASPGGELPPGFNSELRLADHAWIEEIAASLQSGVLLIIDYGFARSDYYHPQRAEGHLLCHYRHRVHGDPLILAGLQDITVGVDFTSLAEAAERSALTVAGLTTQADFLLASGIDEMIAETAYGTRQHLDLIGQAKRLILPGEMGEMVKVMALARGIEIPQGVLGSRDLRGRL